jgi:hypothetical protein
MPSAIHVLLCSLAALAFWGAIGLALGSRLLPAPLILPLAPSFGWAVHSALALPLYRFPGFSPLTVSVSSTVFLVAAFLLYRSPRSTEAERSPDVRIPLWTYGLAALLAAVPIMALFPKISDGAATLAGPIFDHSKIAIVAEMARLGLPPGNPFIGVAEQEGPLAYYYLWHFSAAELAVVFGVSSWEADAAMSAFTNFSSLALMMGFATWIGGRATAGIWVVPLAFAASMHNVLSALLGNQVFYSIFLPPSGFAGWLFQTTWAPQHIASSSCVILSSFLIVRLARQPSALATVVLALVSIAGYESSTWVGGIVFGVASPVLAAILMSEVDAKSRMRFVISLAAAALLAAALSYPFLHDQFVNVAARSVSSPIVLYPPEVFNYWVPDNLRRILDLPGYWLALLVIEFPAIYIPGIISLFGSLRSRLSPSLHRATTKVFFVLALVSFLVAGYFSSTFADNNDLGWRAVLPAVFVLTIFAATGLSRWIAAPAPFAAAGALLLLLLGLPRSFDLALTYARGSPSTSGRAFAATPAMWEAVRRHTAPAERVGNNPFFMSEMTPWPVNISWALFADRQSCFAGRELVLPYSSLPHDRVLEIEAQFLRIFDGHAEPDDVRDLAARYRCSAIVLTSRDGAWNRDPFAQSGYYALEEEKAGEWKIYRIIETPAPRITPDHS